MAVDDRIKCAFQPRGECASSTNVGTNPDFSSSPRVPLLVEQHRDHDRGHAGCERGRRGAVTTGVYDRGTMRQDLRDPDNYPEGILNVAGF
jgi:hypothetical protein